MKNCRTCGDELTVSNSTKAKGNKDGINSRCNKCLSEATKVWYQKNKVYKSNYQKEYYHKNKDGILEYHHQYYQENKEIMAKKQNEYNKENKERITEYKRQYVIANKYTLEAQSRKYCNEHPDKIKGYAERYRRENKVQNALSKKRYRQGNKDKTNVITQRYRAKKRLLPSTLTAEQWKESQRYFNNSCAYCGKKSPLEQEHFLAQSKGGGYTKDNMIPACKSCNCSKLASGCLDWYRNKKFYSKKREKAILAYLGYKNGIQQLALL